MEFWLTTIVAPLLVTVAGAAIWYYIQRHLDSKRAKRIEEEKRARIAEIYADVGTFARHSNKIPVTEVARIIHPPEIRNVKAIVKEGGIQYTLEPNRIELNPIKKKIDFISSLFFTR